MLFEPEKESISKAQRVLDEASDSSTVSKADYEALLNNYKKGVKQASLMVRMADRIQKELQELNEHFEQKVLERTKELEKANRELNQSQKEAIEWAKKAEQAARAKSQFIANMSHEIRNPLNGILGMADLLSSEGMNDEQIECSDAIKSSGQYLLALLNDILDYSKIEAHQVLLEERHFKISQIIDDIESSMQLEAKRRELQFISQHDIESDSLLIGDSTRFKQVLHNLLGNAMKFTARGSVTFALKLQKKTPDLAHISVNVIDTGIGIKEDDQTHVFAHFSQVDETMSRTQSGTGLGLAISQEIVSLMGGQIHLKSTYGEGSTFGFDIELPILIIDTATSEQLPAESSKELPCSKKSILVVEDNPINQKLMCKILKKYGYETESAINGQIAVDILSNKSFDLILMDIQMPEMDGYTAARIIRDPQSSVLNHETPIIAVTAHAMKDDHDKCIEAGMDDYLSKPVDKAKLKMAIEQKLFPERIGEL